MQYFLVSTIKRPRSPGCRAHDGTCQRVNITWTEKRGGYCLDYECQSSSLGYVSKLIKQGEWTACRRKYVI